MRRRRGAVPRLVELSQELSKGAHMAGMSGRFSTVVKAKINKLLDKAEDPGE